MAMEMQFSLIDMAFTWYVLAVVAGHPTNNVLSFLQKCVVLIFSMYLLDDHTYICELS